MVSVDQAYMVGHMKNADGSINNKNVVLSAACEAAELFQCMTINSIMTSNMLCKVQDL